MPSISDLNYRNQFVEALPGDPRQDNATRQVFDACYSRVTPTPVPAPKLLALVPEVAALLDLDNEPSETLVSVLAGNLVLPGMKPYAACYGGHQFGNWAGQLGDGRAMTLAEVVNARGEAYEIQLKGAGPTPYSRRADGRAVLRSSLRELVCSEAMFHLGVPTTRALSLVATGAPVERDMLYDGNPAYEPGAIVCRVAPSFLRFGNYEIHAARKDHQTLTTLLQYTLHNHYPQFIADGPEGKLMDLPGLLREVCQRTATMLVHWMRVGFVHGVMNTDNMSILGLTIDYGPYGWVEPFDPNWTPNITDAQGRRYRFGAQPRIAFWNLLQLAGAFASLGGETAAFEDALSVYREELERQHRQMMLGKLGLTERVDATEDDDRLIAQLVQVLVMVETDMSIFFRKLADLPLQANEFQPHAALHNLREAYYAPDEVTPAQNEALVAFLQAYGARITQEAAPADADRRARMNAVNPLYVPRNYVVQQVIDKTEAGDTQALTELLDVLRHPYTAQPGREAFAAKRPEWARHKPGCSMLSCSS
ncbi:MAG: YdiU family protein [Deltaproteobacteria bacterium]|nr:YdiU family protein [Deltaproteobacteria bacterium]